jgi:tyrosinase
MFLQQVLYNHVQNIAAMYPPQVRRKYVNAAVTFRAPYWDWALTPPSGESVLPESLQVLNVLVDGPVGKQMIGNPLYSYDFHPLDPNDIPSFPVCHLLADPQPNA